MKLLEYFGRRPDSEPDSNGVTTGALTPWRAGKNGRRREPQLRYLSQAVFLEESGSPRSLTNVALLSCVGFAALVMWASFTEVNEISHAPGSVVPSGLEQVVQHMDGGLIKTIDVSSGDLVDKGDVILTLDDGATNDTLDKTRSQLLNLQLTAHRLQAQLDNAEPEFDTFKDATSGEITAQKNLFSTTAEERHARVLVIKSRIRQKKNDVSIIEAEINSANHELPTAEKILRAREKLNEKGLISFPRLAAAQQDVIKLQGRLSALKEKLLRSHSAISESEDELNSLQKAAKLQDSQALSEAIAEIRQTNSSIKMLEARKDRMTMRAPVRGIVKAVNVNTIGSVISAGTPIATIVPLNEELVVESQIAPRDIGHIRPGLDVHVKISAFDFTKYGTINGRIEKISTSTFTGENGARYYKAKIRLDKAHIGDEGNRNIILPGMMAMADIQTGKKTILQYLLKPVRVAANASLTER